MEGDEAKGGAAKLSYAPVILESPVNIECKVTEVKELGSHDMFLAQVVAVQVDEKYMKKDGKFELNSTGLLTYSHGEYFGLGKELGRFGHRCGARRCLCGARCRCV